MIIVLIHITKIINILLTFEERNEAQIKQRTYEKIYILGEHTINFNMFGSSNSQCCKKYEFATQINKVVQHWIQVYKVLSK